MPTTGRQASQVHILHISQSFPSDPAIFTLKQKCTPPPLFSRLTHNENGVPRRGIDRRRTSHYLHRAPPSRKQTRACARQDYHARRGWKSFRECLKAAFPRICSARDLHVLSSPEVRNVPTACETDSAGFASDFAPPPTRSTETMLSKSAERSQDRMPSLDHTINSPSRGPLPCTPDST